MIQVFTKHQVTLALLTGTLLLSGCGGSGTESSDATDTAVVDTSPSADSGRSVAVDSVDYDSGLWVGRLTESVQVGAVDANARFERVEQTVMLYDTVSGVRSDCQSRNEVPVLPSEFQVSEESMAEKLRLETLEGLWGVDLTLAMLQQGDHQYRVEVTGDGYQWAWDLRRVTAIPKFASGSASMTGNRLPAAVATSADVCANYTRVTETAADHTRHIYNLGVPTAAGRLMVQLDVDDVQLAPGTYNLRETDQIEVSVALIQTPTDGETVSSVTELYSTWNPLRTGSLTIVSASERELTGRFELLFMNDDSISADFDVTLSTHYFD